MFQKAKETVQVTVRKPNKSQHTPLKTHTFSSIILRFSPSSCSWRVIGVFPLPWSWRWSWSLHLFLGHPLFLRPFALYCSACFGSLFMSILCTCCSHFSWYCFMSFTMFCAPVFSLIHWFFSLSSFIIPSNCHKNFICAASKRCSSLFFNTQASLPKL